MYKVSDWRQIYCINVDKNFYISEHILKSVNGNVCKHTSVSLPDSQTNERQAKEKNKTTVL